MTFRPHQLGRQSRQHRIRQHRVDMDGPGPLAPMVGSVDPGPAQHLPLVEDGLSHTAFADQSQAAIVDKNAHVCLLYRSARPRMSLPQPACDLLEQHRQPQTVQGDGKGLGPAG